MFAPAHDDAEMSPCVRMRLSAHGPVPRSCARPVRLTLRVSYRRTLTAPDLRLLPLPRPTVSPLVRFGLHSLHPRLLSSWSLGRRPPSTVYLGCSTKPFNARGPATDYAGGTKNLTLSGRLDQRADRMPHVWSENCYPK